MVNDITPETEATGSKLKIAVSITAFFAVCMLLFSFVNSFLGSSDPFFPTTDTITIPEGLTQHDITKMLAERNVVRSSLYLDMLLQIYYADMFIQAGTYHFDTPRTSREVARSITQGDDQTPLISVTFPEGFQVKDILKFLPSQFEKEDVSNLKQFEGRLFPDTYFISNTTNLTDILSTLEENFIEKLEPYNQRIQISGFTQDEVIILASIIEREAKDTESKHMVSGILQNRLRITMPLQVDATFDYILGKASHELTGEDLDIDSPYNTYLYSGLPPTPIANPGLDAIEAVLTPTKTNNLYYLTGEDGTFYYAKTFEDHKRNKERYLR